MKTAAEMIREYREAHGISQVYLGKRTGIRADRISQWECGYVRIPADAFLKIIVDGFGVAPANFFAEALSENENDRVATEIRECS